ncbi:MAG: hypothetical protein MZU97_23980 [Bacillus subtilis]|nr:hypothetical protein [Bacillus subtilis]
MIEKRSLRCSRAPRWLRPATMLERYEKLRDEGCDEAICSSRSPRR